MKRVEIKLNVEIVAPLLDVIREAADDLRPKLASDPQLPEHDAEFAEVWTRDLLAHQNNDIEHFIALFDRDFFAEGVIALESHNSEPVLRASAAVRLRLRAKHLATLGDETLETGLLVAVKLPDEQRRAFAAYVFLATLQELVVQHLDPTEQE